MVRGPIKGLLNDVMSRRLLENVWDKLVLDGSFVFVPIFSIFALAPVVVTVNAVNKQDCHEANVKVRQ